MNFNKWILKETPRGVARALGVDSTTVCAWQQGRSCPRPEKMKRIKSLSQGDITYDNIIDYYLRNRKS